MRNRWRERFGDVASAFAALAGPALLLLAGAAGLALVLLAEAADGAVTVAEGGPVRRIEVTASRYQFNPAQIEVQQGDTVDVVLHSADTEHGFAIKALGVKVTVPKGGAPVEATFVAREAGRFVIECSEYCGSGHKRMKGELVVTERPR